MKKIIQNLRGPEPPQLPPFSGANHRRTVSWDEYLVRSRGLLQPRSSPRRSKLEGWADCAQPVARPQTRRAPPARTLPSFLFTSRSGLAFIAGRVPSLNDRTELRVSPFLGCLYAPRPHPTSSRPRTTPAAEPPGRVPLGVLGEVREVAAVEADVEGVEGGRGVREPEVSLSEGHRPMCERLYSTIGGCTFDICILTNLYIPLHTPLHCSTL